MKKPRKLPLIDTLAKRHDLAWQHLLSVTLTFASEKEAAEFLEAVKAAKGKKS